MFLTCLGCSGQKYALIPDQSAPHNAPAAEYLPQLNILLKKLILSNLQKKEIESVGFSSIASNS
jgi:hypothetical protein